MYTLCFDHIHPSLAFPTPLTDVLHHVPLPTFYPLLIFFFFFLNSSLSPITAAYMCHKCAVAFTGA